LPKHVVHASRLVSPSAGSIIATGTSFCLGSQTLTAPSRLAVAISGAPSPIPRPPIPSIAFIISLCAFTE